MLHQLYRLAFHTEQLHLLSVQHLSSVIHVVGVYVSVLNIHLLPSVWTGLPSLRIF